MPNLKTVLGDLHPFALLRDTKGVIRPVCRILELDGDLDAGAYMREGIEPVRIHSLIDGTPDPVPVFEQVFVEVRIGDVTQRLSAAGRAWVAAMIEVGCALAVAEAAIARRYVVVVPIEPMQAAAVASVFVIAWAKDHDRAEDFPTEAAIADYLRGQVREALKASQREARSQAQRAIDSALGFVRYATDAIDGLRTLATPLQPGSIATRRDFQVRAAAERLATSLSAAVERIAQRRTYEVPEIVAAPAHRRRPRRRMRQRIALRRA